MAEPRSRKDREAEFRRRQMGTYADPQKPKKLQTRKGGDRRVAAMRSEGGGTAAGQLTREFAENLGAEFWESNEHNNFIERQFSDIANRLENYEQQAWDLWHELDIESVDKLVVAALSEYNGIGRESLYSKVLGTRRKKDKGQRKLVDDALRKLWAEGKVIRIERPRIKTQGTSTRYYTYENLRRVQGLQRTEGVSLHPLQEHGEQFEKHLKNWSRELRQGVLPFLSAPQIVEAYESQGKSIPSITITIETIVLEDGEVKKEIEEFTVELSRDYESVKQHHYKDAEGRKIPREAILQMARDYNRGKPEDQQISDDEYAERRGMQKVPSELQQIRQAVEEVNKEVNAKILPDAVEAADEYYQTVLAGNPKYYDALYGEYRKVLSQMDPQKEDKIQARSNERMAAKQAKAQYNDLRKIGIAAAAGRKWKEAETEPKRLTDYMQMLRDKKLDRQIKAGWMVDPRAKILTLDEIEEIRSREQSSKVPTRQRAEKVQNLVWHGEGHWPLSKDAYARADVIAQAILNGDDDGARYFVRANDKSLDELKKQIKSEIESLLKELRSALQKAGELKGPEGEELEDRAVAQRKTPTPFQQDMPLGVPFPTKDGGSKSTEMAGWRQEASAARRRINNLKRRLDLLNSEVVEFNIQLRTVPMREVRDPRSALEKFKGTVPAEKMGLFSATGILSPYEFLQRPEALSAKGFVVDKSISMSPEEEKAVEAWLNAEDVIEETGQEADSQYINSVKETRQAMLDSAASPYTIEDIEDRVAEQFGGPSRFARDLARKYAEESRQWRAKAIEEVKNLAPEDIEERFGIDPTIQSLNDQVNAYMARLRDLEELGEQTRSEDPDVAERVEEYKDIKSRIDKVKASLDDHRRKHAKLQYRLEEDPDFYPSEEERADLEHELEEMQGTINNQRSQLDSLFGRLDQVGTSDVKREMDRMEEEDNVRHWLEQSRARADEPYTQARRRETILQELEEASSEYEQADRTYRELKQTLDSYQRMIAKGMTSPEDVDIDRLERDVAEAERDRYAARKQYEELETEREKLKVSDESALPKETVGKIVSRYKQLTDAIKDKEISLNEKEKYEQELDDFFVAFNDLPRESKKHLIATLKRSVDIEQFDNAHDIRTEGLKILDRILLKRDQKNYPLFLQAIYAMHAWAMLTASYEDLIKILNTYGKKLRDLEESEMSEIYERWSKGGWHDLAAYIFPKGDFTPVMVNKRFEWLTDRLRRQVHKAIRDTNRIATLRGQLRDLLDKGAASEVISSLNNITAHELTDSFGVHPARSIRALMFLTANPLLKNQGLGVLRSKYEVERMSGYGDRLPRQKMLDPDLNPSLGLNTKQAAQMLKEHIISILDEVLLENITDEPQLNGLKGKVVGFDINSKPVIVELADNDRFVDRYVRVDQSEIHDILTESVNDSIAAIARSLEWPN